LRNSATTGVGDIVFVYGDPSDTTLMGDWNGDGTDTPGVVRNGVWHLRNSNTTGFGEISLAYGDPGDTPVVGDWDGNGTDTPGGVEGPGAFEQDGFATATWRLHNNISSTDYAGFPSFSYRAQGKSFFTGDWNGDGRFSPGAFDAERGIWSLRNANTDGGTDSVFRYGDPGDRPLTWE
jgi:hypothetical protein